MYLLMTSHGCVTLGAGLSLGACDCRALNPRVLMPFVEDPAQLFRRASKARCPGSRRSHTLVLSTLSILSRGYKHCLPTNFNGFARKGSCALAAVAVSPRLSVAAPMLLPLWMQAIENYAITICALLRFCYCVTLRTQKCATS